VLRPVPITWKPAAAKAIAAALPMPEEAPVTSATCGVAVIMSSGSFRLRSYDNTLAWLQEQELSGN
jgi:hypothetical protein